jgi:hypothetical protein
MTIFEILHPYCHLSAKTSDVGDTPGKKRAIAWWSEQGIYTKVGFEPEYQILSNQGVSGGGATRAGRSGGAEPHKR